MRYRFSESAETDLHAIVYYIALDNEGAAERVLDAVLDTCEMIASMPGIGRNPDFLESDDIFHVPVKKYGKYQIFYRVANHEIENLWVVHGARDLPNTLGRQ